LARKPTPFELVRPGMLMAQKVAEANMMLVLRMWGFAAAWKMAADGERRAGAARAEAPQAPARPQARPDAPGDAPPNRPRTPGRAARSRRAAGAQP
jgi:hypothetical protein